MPGTAGSTVFSAVYINAYGLLTSGSSTGIIDVRALRDDGPDETALQTFSIVPDYKDSATGLWAFRHYISHDWFLAKNMTVVKWQIKARRRIKKLSIKEGFYAKGTND